LLKIEKAESILGEQKVLIEQKESEKNKSSSGLLIKHSEDYYKCLKFKSDVIHEPITDRKRLSDQFYLCQLIRDMISVSEATNWNVRPSSQARYRSIGAFIRHCPPESPEYADISRKILTSSQSTQPNINIVNIFQVIRPNEGITFKDTLANCQQLFHGSRVENFLGIMSRGLLLPHCVISDMGVERTDAGSLGAGIYFSDQFTTSLKYCRQGGRARNTRVLAVCDVALGNCKDCLELDTSLSRPPDGYDSTHGVVREGSQFVDSEYVVYDQIQCRLKYLIEFATEPVKVYQASSKQQSREAEMEDKEVEVSMDVVDAAGKANSLNLDEFCKDEKKTNPTNSCLKSKHGDTAIPLRSVHVRAEIIDMVSRVVIFQEFENTTESPIEAVYVFPLEDTAAVCAFEAFINEKHLVGVCKEKQKAHQEYREAIEQKKGAYLMDQESPGGLFKV
jgi:poly [ADP-ribose] polymerase